MKGVEEGDDKQNLPGERKRKKERKKSFQETGRKSLDRIGREGEARRERGGREGPGNSRERRGHKKRLYHRNRRNGSSQLSAL